MPLVSLHARCYDHVLFGVIMGRRKIVAVRVIGRTVVVRDQEKSWVTKTECHHDHLLEALYCSMARSLF